MALVGDVTGAGQCAVKSFDRNCRAVFRGEEGQHEGKGPGEVGCRNQSPCWVKVSDGESG